MFWGYLLSSLFFLLFVRTGRKGLDYGRFLFSSSPLALSFPGLFFCASVDGYVGEESGWGTAASELLSIAVRLLLRRDEGGLGVTSPVVHFLSLVFFCGGGWVGFDGYFRGVFGRASRDSGVDYV